MMYANRETIQVTKEQARKLNLSALAQDLVNTADKIEIDIYLSGYVEVVVTEGRKVRCMSMRLDDGLWCVF